MSIPRPFLRVDIAALDDDRRQKLVERWHDIENLDEKAWRELPAALAGLAAHYAAGDGGQSPLDNPLLLTCVLLVYIEKGRLPNNTADLYERMVRHLCDRRPEDPKAPDAKQQQSAEQRRELLLRVGHALQSHGTTAIPAQQLCKRLVAEKRFTVIHDARTALDQIAVSTGLLRFESEGGTQVVRPWHRSFQEYLAACAIAGRTGSESDIVTALSEEGILANPSWEGCLRFAVGAFGETGPERARGFVGALVAKADTVPDSRRGRLLGLAAAGVVEYGREYFTDPPFPIDLRTLVKDRFAASGMRWPWRDRFLALSALGRLPGGDPRLPDPTTSREGWVPIPAGGYTIGGDEEAYQSLPSQKVRVGRFFLRAWPVTVQEYQAFLKETPGETPDEWNEQVHCLNAPVVGVSWHQARAFCRWASKRWQRPERSEGTFDLPDSCEWEVAARYHHKGGLYPWGDAPPGEGDDARANHWWSEDTPSKPTPVGMFPTGNAGALLDMAGNVWEWCASFFGDKRDTHCHEEDTLVHEGDTPDGAPRVLRGGSWRFRSPRDLRVALRNWGLPHVQVRDIGFRLVFRSPSMPLVP